MLAWEAEFFKHFYPKRFVVYRYLERLRAKFKLLFKVHHISPARHVPRRRPKGRAAALPLGNPIAYVPSASSGVFRSKVKNRRIFRASITHPHKHHRATWRDIPTSVVPAIECAAVAHIQLLAAYILVSMVIASLVGGILRRGKDVSTKPHA